MSRLTRQEQLAICFIAAFLLFGWMVKAFRTAHPVPTVSAPAAPQNQ